jgi:hypothetical protein
MNIQHSSRTDQWGTPVTVLALVHKVLGQIDLDPASNEKFNMAVQATHFYTKEIDALSLSHWHAGSVFLNPPGGKTDNRSNTELFWSHLMGQRQAGRVTHAIFMAFSLEALQTTQRDGQGGALRFPLCIPRKRIKFVDSYGAPGPAPSHSNAIVYVPGTIDKTDLFLKTFKSLGACR